MNDLKFFTLPLFPLGTVLYPGQWLPLNIFEERYKLMINQCLKDEKPFGIVFIREGHEVGTPADPYDVGTVAKIIQVQHREEGQMGIIVLGLERFEIQDYAVTEAGYLQGTVSKLPTDNIDPLLVMQQIDEAKELLATYLDLICKSDEKLIGEIKEKLAMKPEPLTYQIATILNIGMHEKQSLLEAADVGQRLNREINFLQREIDFLQAKMGSSTYKLPWGGEVNLN